MNQVVAIKIDDMVTLHKGLTPDEGERIYKLICQALKNGDNVILDFAGMEIMTTAFLNMVIGILYKDYTSDILQKNILVLQISQVLMLLVSWHLLM